MTNAERQALWRSRHPDKVKLGRWLNRFRTLARDCPDLQLRIDLKVTVENFKASRYSQIGK
jgi:hypothetical protein